MIDNKIVMQQALDALIEYDYAKTDKADELGFEVICALREAIAQPEQTAEPVAWMTEDGRVASNATKQMSMASPSKAAFNIPLYLSCSIAQPAEPTPDWLTALNQLYGKITPPPWFGAADGRGVGLQGNRWTANGGFSDVCKKSVSRHGGTHFDNIRFIVALANAWPIIQAAIAEPAHKPIASDAIDSVANPVQNANELDLKWCGSCGEGYAGFCRAKSLQERCPMTQTSNQHASLCAEAYQVVGSLLSDLRQFDTDKGRKVLDNLSQGCVVHNDVLPWPSFVKVVDEFSIADLALEHFGEYSEKHYDFAVSLLDLDNVEVRGIK